LIALALLALAASHAADVQDLPEQIDDRMQEVSLIQAEEAGSNTAQCWRLKSLTRSNGLRDGFEWAVSTLKMYETSDCSGNPLSGEAFSSGAQLKDCMTLHVNERKKTGCVDTAGRDGAAANAFDGKKETAWVAKRRDPEEYVGIKLAAKKEVKCMKLQQLDAAHGARLAVLEKSQNCEDYARVAEFPDLPLSYTEEKTYPFVALDSAPAGVFQIRSRHKVNMCVGIKAPKEEEEDIKYGIAQRSFADGSVLEMQKCHLGTLPQFWFVNARGLLANVKDQETFLTVPKAEKVDGANKSPEENGAVIAKRCVESCPNVNSDVKFSNNGDGFIMHKTSGFYIFAPKGNELKVGTPIVTQACGNAQAGGQLSNCADKTNAQFDLVPLFTVAQGKKAVNCAPYSHSHPDKLKPVSLDTAWEAQAMCAKDPTCKVYMYVAKDATDAPNDERGKAWFCTGLDVVYSGKSGYQLGFRAMNINEEVTETDVAKRNGLEEK